MLCRKLQFLDCSQGWKEVPKMSSKVHGKVSITLCNRLKQGNLVRFRADENSFSMALFLQWVFQCLIVHTSFLSALGFFSDWKRFSSALIFIFPLAAVLGGSSAISPMLGSIKWAETSETRSLCQNLAETQIFRSDFGEFWHTAWTERNLFKIRQYWRCLISLLLPCLICSAFPLFSSAVKDSKDRN